MHKVRGWAEDTPTIKKAKTHGWQRPVHKGLFRTIAYMRQGEHLFAIAQWTLPVEAHNSSSHGERSCSTPSAGPSTSPCGFGVDVLSSKSRRLSDEHSAMLTTRCMPQKKLYIDDIDNCSSSESLSHSSITCGKTCGMSKTQMKNPDNDQFVRAVLREWLNRADDDHNEPAAPRTWAALAECVQDTDLPGALAKAIRDATAPLPPLLPRNHDLLVT